jgi:hypothetical protein
MAAALNTLIGILVIAVVYNFTSSPYVTIALSSVIGYSYSLATYHNIAFNRRTIRPPYIRYGVVYLTAFILNSSLTTVGLKVYPHFISIQIVVIPLVVVLQWFASNFWAFNPK